MGFSLRNAVNEFEGKALDLSRSFECKESSFDFSRKVNAFVKSVGPIFENDKFVSLSASDLNTTKGFLADAKVRILSRLHLNTRNEQNLEKKFFDPTIQKYAIRVLKFMPIHRPTDVTIARMAKYIAKSYDDTQAESNTTDWSEVAELVEALGIVQFHVDRIELSEVKQRALPSR